MQFLRLALSLLCACALGACDDSAPGGPAGTGGTAGVGASSDGGGGGGSAGSGGAGGSGGILCVNNGPCPPGQYCDLDGAPVGECVPGCREDGECEDEELCNPDSHQCERAPCGSDAECPDPNQYCNNGECIPGCRSTEESCSELDANGRSTICDDETRECLALFACCGGVDMCGIELQAQCEADGGIALQAAADCSSNPCGVQCGDDSDCGNDLTRFCNTVDGQCQDGCRVDEPASCGEGQFCDPDTHQCIDLACGSDDDCSDDRYCDLRDGRGLCLEGCRDDDGCADGESCRDHDCQRICDPMDPNSCGEGQFCNPDTEQCEDLCQQHVDCQEGRFCDAESGACLPGCRDDEGEGGEPNNSQENATVIPLDAPDGQGRRYGSIEGRILCDNNPDVLRIDVPAGARLRIDVTFDQGTPNFELDANSGNCGEDANCAEALEWTCQERTCVAPTQQAQGRDLHASVQYPPVDGLVQDESSYYITIAPTNQRVTYRVDVVVVDALTGCIPDIRERQGDDNAASAVALASGFADTVRGVICTEDEDWFRLNLAPNDGLSMTLRSLGGEAIDAYLIPAGVNRGDPILSANENSDRIDRAQGQSLFVPGGDWYVVVNGRNPNVTGSYELDILHSPSVVDCGDGDQGDTVGTSAMVNVDVDQEVNIGQALDNELAICNANGPDVDVFCFQAGDDEILSAAVVMTGPDAQAGALHVQFITGGNEFVGNEALNTVGMDRLWSRVIGTQNGAYCARVEGVNRHQGPYQLLIRRSADVGAMCGLDVAEAMGPRNDRASSPTALMSMGDRYDFADGYLCDTAVPDEDWYRFNIPEPSSSVCLTVGGFSAQRADIDVGIFPPTGNAQGPNCTVGGQATCDNGGGGACIPGDGGQFFCTPAVEREATQYDFELISIRRNVFRDRAGDYLVRVHHNDANEGPYQLNISITPPSDICADDAHEPNNDFGDEQFLGSGQVTLCDAWICEDEQVDGDRYEIEVPAGEDRTILIHYSALVEGRLFMDASPPGNARDAQANGVESHILAGGYQCVNVRGGAADSSVKFAVTQVERAAPNRIGRTDYSLRVVPTDLAMRPGGECQTMGAPDLTSAEFPDGVCPPRDEWPIHRILMVAIQPNGCWPILDL